MYDISLIFIVVILYFLPDKKDLSWKAERKLRKSSKGNHQPTGEAMKLLLSRKINKELLKNSLPIYSVRILFK